jgi:hypothetical protein
VPSHEEEETLNALSASEWDALRTETIDYVEAPPQERTPHLHLRAADRSKRRPLRSATGNVW